MKGEIEFGARIRGEQIGPNQSIKTTTCAPNDFTSLEEIYKLFLTFTTYYGIL